jgi:aldose 1-epimerase
MAGDLNPLHGQAWLHPWTVHEASETRAMLRYRHEAGEWPWAYEASQEFMLDEAGLLVSLTCRNLGADPMPCGLGQHPYFHCGPRTRIDAQVSDVWTIDMDVLPLDKLAAKGAYDLRERLVCGQDLDNGFGGWSGKAQISDPDWPYEIRLTSDAKFLQIYSPQSGGIFAAEPVTHANAALNEPEARWPDLGMRVLESGEQTSMVMRFEVIAL